MVTQVSESIFCRTLWRDQSEKRIKTERTETGFFPPGTLIIMFGLRKMVSFPFPSHSMLVFVNVGLIDLPLTS